MSFAAHLYTAVPYAALAALGAALILTGIRPHSRALPWCAGAGTVALFFAVLYRYLGAWPMLPMHLAPTLSAALLALFVLVRLCCGRHRETGGLELHRLRTALVLLLCCLTAMLFFPRDFYLPFPRTDSPFAHLMLLSGACGRVCFVLGTAWSLAFFRATEEERVLCLKRALVWMAWGFACWTLAMFSGELWSYLGWGTAVVWDDPALLLMMAAWFLAIFVLHLHFSGKFLRARILRATCCACGGTLILVLGLLADFGPFRPLW